MEYGLDGMDLDVEDSGAGEEVQVRQSGDGVVDDGDDGDDDGDDDDDDEYDDDFEGSDKVQDVGWTQSNVDC